jgi:hypothetical protein
MPKVSGSSQFSSWSDIMQKIRIHPSPILLAVLFTLSLMLLIFFQSMPASAQDSFLSGADNSAESESVYTFPTEQEKTCIVKLLNEAGNGFGLDHPPGTGFTGGTEMIISGIPLGKGYKNISVYYDLPGRYRLDFDGYCPGSADRTCHGDHIEGTWDDYFVKVGEWEFVVIETVNENEAVIANSIEEAGVLFSTATKYWNMFQQYGNCEGLASDPPPISPDTDDPVDLCENDSCEQYQPAVCVDDSAYHTLTCNSNTGECEYLVEQDCGGAGCNAEGTACAEEPLLSCPNYCEDGTSYYDGILQGEDCAYYTSSCGSSGCNPDTGLCGLTEAGQPIILRASIDGFSSAERALDNPENFGTAYISGVISDSVSNKPIAGATVEILSGARLTNVTTDDSGRYAIEAVVDGGSGVEEYSEIGISLIEMYDLRIENLEVFQVIQGSKLVANKPGVARIYFGEPHPDYDHSVAVQLRINGQLYGKPQNHIIHWNYNDVELWKGYYTANIELPGSVFQAGSLDIEAFVVPIEFLQAGLPVDEQSYVDPDLGNNTFSNAPARVTATENLILKFCSAHYRVSEEQVKETMILATNYLRLVYPIAEIESFYSPECVTHFYDTSFIPGVPMTEVKPEYLTITMTLYLATERYFDNRDRGPDEQIDYTIGVVPQGYLDWDFWPIYNKSNNGASIPASRRDVLIVYDPVGAGAYTAHEIGHHGLGRIEGYDEYPPNGFQIETPTYNVSQETVHRIKDPEASREAYGYYYDIMGNLPTHNNWPSAVSWDTLVSFYAEQTQSLTSLSSFKLALPVAPEPVHIQPGYLLAGIVTKTGEVTLDTPVWIDSLGFDFPTAEGSEFFIRTYDDTNTLISEIPVYVDFFGGDASAFSVGVPGSPYSLSKIEMVYRGEIIWENNASSNPPTVSLTSPGGFAVGDTTITWAAQDPDGDHLTSYLSYSADNGNTWRTVSGAESGTSYMLDFDKLPGCTSCLLRVTVSDGWYTTIATSNQAFSVADKTPFVYLDHPLDPEGNPGDTINAYAYDLEDGELDSSLITWETEALGRMSTGETLDLTGWPAGDLGFTVSIQDSAGNIGQEHIDTQGMQQPEVISNTASDLDPDMVTLVCGGSAVLMFIIGGVFIFIYFRRRRQAKRSWLVIFIVIVTLLGCLGSTAIAASVAVDPSLLSTEVVPSTEYDPLSAVSDIDIDEQIGLILDAAANSARAQDTPPAAQPTQEVPDSIFEEPVELITSYTDDFSEDHGWPQLTTEKASLGVADGVYQMRFLKAGDATPQFVIQPYQFNVPGEDIVMEVTGTAVNTNVAYGMVCRYTDTNNYYGFQLRDNGDYWLGKVSSGAVTTYSNGTSDDLITTGQTIRMTCQGEWVKVSVNGTPFAELKDFDLVSGQSGLIAQPMTGDVDSDGVTSILEFDNFSIELMP